MWSQPYGIQNVEVEEYHGDWGVLVATGTNGNGDYDEVSSNGFEADRFKIYFEVWNRSEEVPVWGFLLTPGDVEVQSYTWTTGKQNAPYCSWRQST